MFANDFISRLAVKPFNHLLKQNSWASARLKPFSGKIVRFLTPPVSHDFVVTASGELSVAPKGGEPDAVCSVSPVQVARMLLTDKSVFTEIEINGDAEYSSAVRDVLENLSWDVEEDLSKILGDVVAHRLTTSGKKVFATGKQSAESLVRMVSEYWTEEQPLLAKAYRARQLAAEVDAVSDSTEKLEQRLENVYAKLVTHSHKPIRS